MTSQFNWSLFRRTAHTHTHTEKHQSYISQPFWGGNPRQWTPLTQASISESVPMRLRHHIPGALIYEETRTRTMTTKTHCFHLYVDVMTYIHMFIASPTLCQGNFSLDYLKKDPLCGALLFSFYKPQQFLYKRGADDLICRDAHVVSLLW